MFYLRIMDRKPNQLILAASPYLQQHAYNPVNWYPWCDEALQKAQREDKLILVSIGYSACHWCHVMEHESFENEEVAEWMNNFFVCIKVDREERPDIDQVYMSAVQLLTGRGGWPLNCFALPDGRPVYGGTYFPRKQWLELLGNLASMYRNDRSRLVDYAEQLSNGVASSDQINPAKDADAISMGHVTECVSKWKQLLDYHEGGPDRAPKFPLPNNYLFLMRYAIAQKDDELQGQVRLTLRKMAFGGIYDQVGGGFARYSVDGIWKVPHFEKMLYDNAQLLSLYSEAFRCWRDPLYRDIVYQTADFMDREWRSEEGAYYAALDADSEGEEGKYYVWTTDEIAALLGDDTPLAVDYFNFNERGHWEHGNHIPLRHDDDEVIAQRHQLSLGQLDERVRFIRAKLLHHREGRVRPGLDDKRLTSWNALAVSGFVSAYMAFNDSRFLTNAQTAFDFISKQMRRDDGGLFHSWKPGSVPINGFLEDYCFAIAAAVDLYKVTFEFRYIETAVAWMRYAIVHFFEAPSDLFRFTSDLDAPLFASKIDFQDNVIPASNSQMAQNLYTLSYYTGNSDWDQLSRKMVQAVLPMSLSYGSAFSNWLDLACRMRSSFEELVICGEGATAYMNHLQQNHYVPYIMVDGAILESKSPATVGRLHPEKLFMYRCRDRVCDLPIEISDRFESDN